MGCPKVQSQGLSYSFCFLQDHHFSEASKSISKSDLILNADESNFIVFATNQEAIEVVSNIQRSSCLSFS